MKTREPLSTMYLVCREGVSLLFLLALAPAVLALKCSESEFGCEDGSRCVPRSWFCDGSLDCLDSSDEPDSCPLPSCQESQFKCKISGTMPSTFLYRTANLFLRYLSFGRTQRLFSCSVPQCELSI